MSYTEQDVIRVAQEIKSAIHDASPYVYGYLFGSEILGEVDAKNGPSRRIARAALEAMAREPISFEGDWKKRFANDVEPAIQYDVTQEVIDELLLNLGSNRNSLPYYGILKVCNVVAQVARAQALGIDPDIFRMTDDEAAAVMLERAQAFADAGKPVIVVKDTAPESDDA